VRDALVQVEAAVDTVAELEQTLAALTQQLSLLR